MTNQFGLPDLNVGLLRDLVTWAAADHDMVDNFIKEKFADWGSHDQEVWAKEIRNGVCETAYCIAGQAVIQTGYVMVTDAVDTNGKKTALSAQDCVKAPTGWDYKKDGGFVSILDEAKIKKIDPNFDIEEEDIYSIPGIDYIGTVARKELGLTPIESDRLFNGDNEIIQIIAYAVAFAKTRGIDLTFPGGLEDRIPAQEWETAANAAAEAAAEATLASKHWSNREFEAVRKTVASLLGRRTVA